MTEYTIDQIADHRLKGWKAEEWVYISTVGELDVLGEVSYIKPCDSYKALYGMSIIIVTTKATASQAYDIGDKVLNAGVRYLAVWVLENPHIAELVFCGHRYQTAKVLPLDPEFQKLVTEFSQELAA